MRLPGRLGIIHRRALRNSDEADMLKLPRTIRLDRSDTFVFERAAEPGEWAVSGAFVFWNLDPARLAAEEEVAFAASLCDHAPQTLLAVQRSVEDGEIRERFRTLKPREMAPGADRLHAALRAFSFHEVEGDIEPAEEVDLLGLIKTARSTTDRT